MCCGHRGCLMGEMMKKISVLAYETWIARCVVVRSEKCDPIRMRSIQSARHDKRRRIYLNIRVGENDQFAFSRLSALIARGALAPVQRKPEKPDLLQPTPLQGFV